MRRIRLLIIAAFAIVFTLVACSDDDSDIKINIAVIPGVTAPIIGEIPVTMIPATDQYTGTVTWDGGWAWSSRFGGNKVYTATITLMPKTGYTLTGVAAGFFTVTGATNCTNAADSGVVTAIFPATATVNIGESRLGGQVAYILQSGDPGFFTGEQRGLIAAVADQEGIKVWSVGECQSNLVPEGTGTALGTGSANTDKIIAQNEVGSIHAASLARACIDGGYNDWFLPSKDELNKLFVSNASLSNFVWNYYWSSSETTATHAWRQDFAPAGTQNEGLKAGGYKVRPIRVF